MPLSRRRFLTDSTAAAAGAGAASLLPAGVRARAQGVSPSDRIVVGVIGCNGMGFSNLALACCAWTRWSAARSATSMPACWSDASATSRR